MIDKKGKKDEELIVDVEDVENFGKLVDDDEYKEGEADELKKVSTEDEEYDDIEDDTEIVDDDEEYDDVEDDTEIVEEDEGYDEVEDDEEYEEIDDDEEYDEINDDEEYEEVDEDEEYDEIGDEDAEEYEEVEDDDEFEEIEEDENGEVVDEDAEEYEEVEDDDEFEEIEEDENSEVVDEDTEEYEEVDDDEFEEIEEDENGEIVDEDAEEYEEVEDDDEFEEIEEIEDENGEVVDEDAEEYEEVEDDEFEETEEIEDENGEALDEDTEEYEEVDDDDEFEETEEIEDENGEVVDEDAEEYEEVEDDDEFEETEESEDENSEALDEDTEEYEEVEDDDGDYEETEEIEDENSEALDEDTEEYEEVEDDDGDYEETEEIEDENSEALDEDTEEYEEDVENDDESEETEEEPMRFADEEPIEEDEEDDDEEDEDEEENIYPDELVDLELECVYIGLLFNNPKAISRFYFLYDDCKFSNSELYNLYRIIIFRDGEAYAPAIAKDKYQLPRETPKTYDLKYKVRKMAVSKKYDLEKVYTDLKKLFILKKNYMIAPTSAIQQQILDIQNYDLYEDMTVEEVESALEQITVTTGLSRAVLNENATSFLLADDNELSNGISLPFPTLTTVFKGIRKGETMTYAMPSNSGKSRFTIELACYIAFIHKKKVLVISNEMSQEKMRLCMITTILNNPEIQKLHKQNIRKTEGELLELKFRPDANKKVKCDEDGFILRKDGESIEDFRKRLEKNSTEFKKTIAATEWLNTQLNNSIYFIHITEHSNDDLKKIIMNYYYKEAIEYIFYDTLKADTENIGNGNEIKKTATILSNLAQKFKMWIGSSMQLLESSTLPVNLTINDMSASKTVKEVLDTLCLIKQISRQSLHKYEYSDTDQFEKCYDIKVPKDTDVRFYACVVDKNRAGAKPTLLFRLNLAYNEWEEMGHLRLKQSEIEED